MQDLAARLAGELVDVEHDLDREFEARLAETSTLAFRVAFSVLRHRQDAEDVAQEAYARAYRRFRSLRDRDRFRAWLVRMTWRLALDHRRAQGRRTARELSQIDAGTPQTTTDLLAARERASSLWAAIDELPERLRLVVVLAAIEEHDLVHVADVLGLPVGTVKSRLFQARRHLKERLQWLATPRG
jgi:RNA polymerase sigma-70 factor, ECF subfamily